MCFVSSRQPVYPVLYQPPPRPHRAAKGLPPVPLSPHPHHNNNSHSSNKRRRYRTQTNTLWHCVVNGYPGPATPKQSVHPCTHFREKRDAQIFEKKRVFFYGGANSRNQEEEKSGVFSSEFAKRGCFYTWLRAWIYALVGSGGPGMVSRKGMSSSIITFFGKYISRW